MSRRIPGRPSIDIVAGLIDTPLIRTVHEPAAEELDVVGGPAPPTPTRRASSDPGSPRPGRPGRPACLAGLQSPHAEGRRSGAGAGQECFALGPGRRRFTTQQGRDRGRYEVDASDPQCGNGALELSHPTIVFSAAIEMHNPLKHQGCDLVSPGDTNAQPCGPVGNAGLSRRGGRPRAPQHWRPRAWQAAEGARPCAASR